MRQVSVVLDCNKGIPTEHLSGKGVVSSRKSFRLECGVIPVKEPLCNIEPCRLSCTCSAIKHNTFLNVFSISGDNCSNGPFKFTPFWWFVQNTDKVIVCSVISRL